MNELINEAIVHTFIGVGLAVLNLVIRYFAPVVPRVISIQRWGLRPRVFLFAYLIALVLQLISSPLFRSYLTSAYTELAWSPYQALWNVAGVLLVDLGYNLWTGARRGVAAGRKQFDTVKTRAAEGLEELSAQVPLTAESREAYEARRKAEEQAAAETTAERKERLDDRLKDY
jgi:hypothetical protein